MNTEPIIQSEISQKGNDKYCILTHMYGNGTEEFICSIETDIQYRLMDMGREEERVRCMDREQHGNLHYHM